jgi:amino acid adenylation domain-containing protein
MHPTGYLMSEPGADGPGLTHSQTQIWVGQRLHPESPLYNMAFAFVLPAELRPDLFCEAWRSVADRSDVLRTRIDEHDGTAFPRIDNSGAPPTRVLEPQGWSDPEAGFHRWCQERCARPLPLSGALVDSVLVPLGGGRTGWYLNQHHLITDAWSTLLLYQQVGSAYATLLANDEPDQPSYPDYYPTALALQSRSGTSRTAADHWQARQARPGRSVPLYGRDPDPSDTRSTRRTLELDEGRSRAIDRLRLQEGFNSFSGEVSRFAVFSTLVTSWLHRISGRHDLGFDAPVSGRPTPDSKRAVGLFIEMFPFAATVEPDDSFRSLGARCLAEAMLFLRHALPGSSSPSGATASNIVLNYFPGSFGPFAGVPVEAEWVHPGHGDSVHALRLQVHDFSGSGRLTLHFDCNDSVLPGCFQSRAVEHFEKILDACLDDPDRAIASVDILVDEERLALSSLNAGRPSPPADASVVAMFEDRADVEPDRIVLREGSKELSFGVLRDQATALAAVLVARGVERGDRVAILDKRSSLAVTAILAVLRARAAFVPIEHSTPRARLEHVVDDSGAKILLLGAGVDVDLDLPGVTTLAIDEGIRAGHGLELDRRRPDRDDLAYLIYTSGSTGQPKGVLVEHGGLAQYLQWAASQYARGDRLTYPLFTSLAFDLTITSLFLPLITGGTLEIYPEPEGPVDSALMDVVREDVVDFIKLTPSHLSLLARVGLENSRIRRMVVGGENLRAQLAATISSQLDDQVEIYNEYGPTEAVVGCVMHRYDRFADTGVSVPIGIPADHVEVEVLNHAGAPVPGGVPGELWVVGPDLARGYHGLDALTEERFKPHPDRPGENRYRTGDMVRMTESGVLEYLGRRDRQLKVSGYRVEPAEIEASLQALPMIEQCAVVARRSSTATQRTAQEVRHCVRCGLPSNYPKAVFDQDGVCSVCRTYESIKDHAQAYFKTEDDLRSILEESAQRHGSEYDCMMLYSGGKDSTYALCRLVEMGVSVYAFTLDNGFISEGAKENIRKVTEQLGVAVEFATTPAMNDIFRDSLMRFSNVCNGCFKTIYTLSMKRARELGIPIIVTGLSRGQMFETRLTEDMFRDGRCSPDEVDAAVLAARKVYHRVADVSTRLLDVSIFENDRIFEEVQFVDFYRYVDVGMDELYSYLRAKVPWVRPSDTGRSTNCLINDIGIYVHTRERGYHNYALPYSWDVRLGHKDREAALDELDDEIDLEHVRKTLEEIGYDEEHAAASSDHTALEAFFVASEEVSEQELRRLLGERLPAPMVPVHLQQVDSIPLTASGKVDEKALQTEALDRLSESPYRAPEGPVAEYLAGVWQEELGVDRVGANDDFFELGGTSLTAMQVMLRLCREFSIDLPLETLFTHPVLAELARVAEDQILADVADIPDSDRHRLLGETDASI